MKSKISVVIPVYNAANSLEELYGRLVDTLKEITNDFEIIMVDDYSQDNSYKKMIDLNKKDNRLKIIKLADNYGQQNAIICGFNFISGDYIVTLDDDLQHKPEDIVKLYDTITKGYEVVYGIPVDREYNWFRKIGSQLTDRLFGLITPKSSDIRVSSFRIIKKELVKKIVKYKDSFVYISVIILKQTDNIANINVIHNNRKHGESNYSFFRLLKLFLKLYIYHGNFSLLNMFQTKKPQFTIEEKIGF